MERQEGYEKGEVRELEEEFSGGFGSKVTGRSEVPLPVTVEMERAVRHEVWTRKAAGELSAARKRSFQYQGPWGSGPRALCATGVGSNCVCDL
uniref:Uncharacterized protein n=1 Tax=Rangifer tarandus platyrhynchus TaxID=3082113 RepID=A0ACB0ENF1_RANTA|nr:unnamed protein product [Rangifer tarandus platyrhynchus]